MLSASAHVRALTRIEQVPAAAWPWLGAASAIGVGVAAGRAPFMLAAALGAVGVAVVFALWPMQALLVLLVARASLEVVDQTAAIVLTGAVLFVAGPVVLALHADRLRGKAVVVPFALLLSLGALSMTYAVDPDSVPGRVLQLDAALMYFVIAATLVRDDRDFKRIVAACLLSSLVPLAMGLWQFASGNTYYKDGYEAILGTLPHPNGFSLYLLAVLPIAIVALLRSRSAGRALALGPLVVVMLLSLYLTYTRATWVGIALALAVLAFAQYRRLLLAIPVVAVVAVMAAPGAIGAIEQRFSDLSPTSTQYTRNSWSWRTELWSKVAPYIMERPVLGYGLESFGPVTIDAVGVRPTFGIRHREHYVAPHNDYFGFAVELGITGAVLWILVWLGLIFSSVRSWRSPDVRPYGVAITGALLGLAVCAISDNVVLYPIVIAYAMTIGGAAVGIGAVHRRSAAAAANATR